MSVLAMMALLLVGCSSIDCPIISTVSARYMVRGASDTLHDTLTVRALRINNSDTILLNRSVLTTYFDIPMSYGQAADQLRFTLTDTTSTIINDTVTLYKTDIPHFESVDCSPYYFHTLTDVKWTSHAIDTIIISKPSVTYDTTGGNLHIYFKSGH
jgi:hypothetical protein